MRLGSDLSSQFPWTPSSSRKIFSHRPTQTTALPLYCPATRHTVLCVWARRWTTRVLMQAEASSSASSSSKYLPARFAQLIWSCLDASLYRSAVFYAERYYSMCPGTHDAKHLYATALLHADQPHNAHHLVNQPSEDKCSGCLEIKAKCCTALGRHRQARNALEECLRDPLYSPTRKCLV